MMELDLTIVAALLLLPASLLQALGYTGTCTQGDHDPFLAGVVFSFPFLIGCILLLGASFIRNRRRQVPHWAVLSGMGSLAVAFIAINIAYANAEVGLYTLVQGFGACGPDHGYVFEGNAKRANVLIGVVYTVLPILIAVLALATFWSALPYRQHNSTPKAPTGFQKSP